MEPNPPGPAAVQPKELPFMIDDWYLTKKNAMLSVADSGCVETGQWRVGGGGKCLDDNR